MFEGSGDRAFRALDSDSGKVLWSAMLDRVPVGAPISFAVCDEQYVAITAGGSNPIDYLRQKFAPEFDLSEPGTALWVSKLPHPTP